MIDVGIQFGDTVKLKTGGAEMLVDRVEHNSASCIWQDNHNHPCAESYAVNHLVVFKKFIDSRPHLEINT